MENHRSTSTIDRSGRPRFVPWESLENRTATAFTLAGASLLASIFVPIGLFTITDWSWLVGIVLVGFAIVSVAVGLLGLYPRGRDHAPGLAITGVTSAIVAGTAGLTVLALSGVTVGAIVLSGVEFSVGKRAFTILAVTMASGYTFGFLSFGIAGLRSDYPPDRTGQLLAGGGFLLLVLVVGALLQLGFGISQPPWILFPILGLVAIDTLAVGISLRAPDGFRSRSTR